MKNFQKPPANDDVISRARVHVIADHEHGSMRTANMGHGYHSLIFLFARADSLKLLYELPEPLRLCGIGTSRGAVPFLSDIRCDKRSITTRADVDTAFVDAALRAGRLKTRRGRAWEFDVVVQCAGLLVVTMG